MASPAVVGTPTETAIGTASTTHTVGLPSGAAGNYFVAVMSKGSAGTTPSINALAGWSEALDEAIVLGLGVLYHLCDGTEGATVDFTLSSATRGAWIVYEISGMQNPATQVPQVGTTATGSSTTPDPPSVSVTGGAKDILTIAFFGRAGEEADDDTWVTAAPAGFGTLLQKACGVAGTNLAGMVASAHLASNTATSNPGTFTAATGAWRAQTVVLHPAPAVHNIAAAETLGLVIDTAIKRETFIAVTEALNFNIATAVTRETFVAAAEALALSITTDLTVVPGFDEHFIAADFPLGLTIDTTVSPVVKVLAVDMPLGLMVDTALTRETFIALAEALNLQIATALTRETFIAASEELGLSIGTALSREAFVSLAQEFGLDIGTNLTVEALIVASASQAAGPREGLEWL